jgi:hypothetical protein
MAAIDWLQSLLGGNGNQPTGEATAPGVLDQIQRLLSGNRQAPLTLGGEPAAGGATARGVAGDVPYRDALSEYGSDLRSGLTSHYDPTRSLAQNVLDPRGLEQALNVALGVGPGGVATRAPKQPGDFPAPNIGKGTETPLFDYSRLTERPDVPQVPLERAPLPAKGVPDWAQAQPSPIRRGSSSTSRF